VIFMLRDFRFAYRMLRKSPVTTGVSVLALALGIAANAAMFVSVRFLLLEPFPYPNLNRIVTVWETVPRQGLERAGVSPANFMDWTSQSKSFEEWAVYRHWTVNLTDAGALHTVDAARVTPSFLRVFGLKPSLGRIFSDSEGQAGNNQVAVISEALWRTQFGAQPDIVGKSVSFGGVNHTIVGIMPIEFEYPLGTQIWAPLTLSEAEKTERDFHSLLAVGLLKPNVQADQAAAELATIAKGLAQDYPRTNEGWSTSVVPLSQLADQVTGRFLSILSIASLFLLLLAVANVANIQLAQAQSHRKTFAVEAALGAGRFHIFRLLCAQGILLAIGGGVLGFWVAAWLNQLSAVQIPAQVYHWVPGIRNIRVDSTVVLFTSVLSLIAGVLCSLPAAGHLLGRRGSHSLTEALSQGGRTAGDMRTRFRHGLVVAEIAIALLLLVGAGVLVRTFQHLADLNLGFNPANLLTAEVSLPVTDYPSDAQMKSFFDVLLPNLMEIPNVTSASIVGEMGRAAEFFVEGRPEPGPTERRPVVRAVDGEYFRTMELPVLRGRAISAEDAAGSIPVAVISTSLAEYYWPGSDPIGKRVRWGRSPWLTIVGVSADVKDWFFNTSEAAGYVSYRQAPVSNMQVRLRTDGDPLRVSNALMSSVRALDAREPIFNIKSMEQSLSEERSGVEAAARMMRGNAVMALFLAVTGIYGVVSCFVSQRTREIGIRIALGATRRGVLNLVFGRAYLIVGAGLAIGIPASYLLMRILSSVLFDVVLVQWSTFLFATALITLAAFVASYLPARRAQAVDPIVALRIE